MISRVKGTEDLLDLRLHNFVLSKAKDHFTCYNFQEIQTPILEPTNLFVRSLGPQTDVVTKEMYTFTTAGGENICLRPELTAPTMRAFLEAGIQQIPWKVWSYGPMFRHERPQKGRWRQFSQINAEIIGTDSIAQDAHLLKMLDRFFSEILNLNEYTLKLNFLGTKEEREKYTKKLHTFLDKVSDKICQNCQERKEKNILRVLDCKNERCIEAYQSAPVITNNLQKKSEEEWEQLCDMLDFLSVSYIHDPMLVRGLDYYNKTAFEFCSPSKELGAQNAFCGGGRYNLSSEIGAKEDYPSIGAAIGMSRLLLMLEPRMATLPLTQPPALHLIIPMTQAQKPLALLLAYELQSHTLCTDIILEDGSMKSMMRKANKMGAKYVLIIGDEEQKNATISVKNMQTGESTIVKQGEILQALQ